MSSRIQVHDTDNIHDLSMHNGKYKDISKKCGCFYCLKIYDASLLNKENQLCEGEDTYFCKHCGIDSLIFDSAYNFDDALLRKMRKQWFS